MQLEVLQPGLKAETWTVRRASRKPPAHCDARAREEASAYIFLSTLGPTTSGYSKITNGVNSV